MHNDFISNSVRCAMPYCHHMSLYIPLIMVLWYIECFDGMGSVVMGYLCFVPMDSCRDNELTLPERVIKA